MLQHGKITKDMQCSQGLSPSSGLQLVLLLLPFTHGHWDRLKGPGAWGGLTALAAGHASCLQGQD